MSDKARPSREKGQAITKKLVEFTNKELMPVNNDFEMSELLMGVSCFLANLCKELAIDGFEKELLDDIATGAKFLIKDKK
mgnify:CR=1 FL=1